MHAGPLCHTLLSSGSSTTTTLPSSTRMMSFLAPVLPFSFFSSGLTLTATTRDDWLVFGTYCRRRGVQLCFHVGSIVRDSLARR